MALPFKPIISPLMKKHNRGDFSCGKEPLDRYLQTQASQDMKRRLAVVFVLEGEDPKEIIGFYALSALSVDVGDLDEKSAKGLPKTRPIPCTLLGQFAVSETWKGKKIGAWLLGHILDSVLQSSRKIASFALIVDAVDEEAYSYWKHCGFISFPNTPNRLFLPMKTIQSWMGG
ncbi:MAG: GNAT family N-acetyltransferase [Robiginitomaculum sp.]|nr:MAG: GNAT family N-acetyltransferase [Robiginitomaculum sp.]